MLNQIYSEESNYHIIVDKIKSEFETLPITTATKLFKGYSKKCFAGAENGEVELKNAIFESAIALIHAKIHCELLSISTKIENGFYVSNKEGWDRWEFAQIIIPAYIKGSNSAKQKVPIEIQNSIKQICPLWFKEKFEIDYFDDGIKFVTNPRPIVMPFDHFTLNRDFIGKEAYIPAGLQLRMWGYMKAMDFPSTIWYSSRPENDLEDFIKRRAEKHNMTLSNSIEETGCHEGVHTIAIDPAIKLAMLGEEHCWLNEGIALFFGDTTTNRERIENMIPIPNILEIVDTVGKPVNYSAGLLLTTALAIKLGGSTNKIIEGMVEIVGKVVDRAISISEGHDIKLSSPTELLYLIDPSLKNEKDRLDMQKLMNNVRKEVILDKKYFYFF